MRALLFGGALLLASFVGAIAGPFPIRGGTASVSCPAGSPSPDGSTILPVATGHVSCTLTDVSATTWQYQGATLVEDGSFFFGYDEGQINSSGRMFGRGLCSTPNIEFWEEITGNLSGNFAPVVSPTNIPTTTYFENTSTSIFYRSVQQLIGGASNGDALEIKTPPAGLNAWFSSSYRITQSNLTLTIDSPAAIWCSQDEGTAIFPFDTGGGPVSGITIQGSGGLAELGYQPGYYGINIGSAVDTTLQHLYIHDVAMGIIKTSGSSASETTINDVTLDHIGDFNHGANTHDIYLSCTNGAHDPNYFTGSISGTTLTVTGSNANPIAIGETVVGIGVTSDTVITAFGSGTGGDGTYTVNNSQTIASESMASGDASGCIKGFNDFYSINALTATCNQFAGFQAKMRDANASGGPITASTFAEQNPSYPHPAGDCIESAAVDMPCGGQYTLGGTAPGTGVVIEVGPDIEDSGSAGFTGMVRFGEEALGYAGDTCPFNTGYPTTAGYGTNTLLIQNAWLINDDPARAIPVVYIPDGFDGVSNFAPYVTSCVVKNSKIVGNGANSQLNWHGTTCSDGGGNTFYASRAAAGLAVYPFIPAPP